MSISINTNVGALAAQQNLGVSSAKLARTFERLSSGLRVNSSRDDAAGLAIASGLTSQIRGYNMASRNANDSISLLQVAEGSLDETSNALQRMRELAVQASNGLLTTTDRENLNVEFAQLRSEVERIGYNTKYNGISLLQGQYSMQIQVGAFEGQMVSIGVFSATASCLCSAKASIGGDGSAAMAAVTLLDGAITSVATMRASIGSLQSRLESVVATLSAQELNTESARSRIMDADVAGETSALTRDSILQQAAASILAQANQSPQVAMTLLGR
ncbi:MAG: flagellin FliC [Magnetococcus sp. DMHC-1]|nr:flagellin FliC [Magnetococcales bacterium]